MNFGGDFAKSMLLMLGASMSKEEILQKVEETIAEYRENPTEENTHNVGMAMQLFLVNVLTKGNVDGAMELSEKMAKMKQAENLITPGKN